MEDSQVHTPVLATEDASSNDGESRPSQDKIVHKQSEDVEIKVTNDQEEEDTLDDGRSQADTEPNTKNTLTLRGFIEEVRVAWVASASDPSFPNMHDAVRRKLAGRSGHSIPYRSLHASRMDVADSEEESDSLNHSHTSSNSICPERRHIRSLTFNFFQSTWVFLLLLGVLASVTAWTLDGAILLLTNGLEAFVQTGGNWIPNYFLYVLCRVLTLLIGVAITFYLCPAAAGSGIPEMRSILGGFPAPAYLSGRTLLTKAAGLVFALGSGLSIGKEGPFVHLSCIIARQLLRIPLFRQIRRSQDLTHHVLSAACAVGVTATFGTPIGGVLFSIEVTTTYYVTRNYWRAFFASVVGVVVFRLLNSVVSESSVSLFATEFDVLPYQSYEISLFLILSVLCGLLSALFVRIYRIVLTLRDVVLGKVVVARWPRSKRWTPFVYAGGVALVFALGEYPVGSFMLLTQTQVVDDMFSEGNLTESDATRLAEVFGTSWSSPSLLVNLFLYFILRFLSTAISATVMVPCGIVTPMLALGASLGRLFGEIVVVFGGGTELAGGYAVVGAAAFTAGVTGTVSIAVIVFELTGQLSYMIPVLLCVLVGRAVALFLSLDFYETISRQKNLPQWPDLTNQDSYDLVAGDIMHPIHPHDDSVLPRQQSLSSLQSFVKITGNASELVPVVDSVESLVFLGVAQKSEVETLVQVWEEMTSSPKSAGASVSKDEEDVDVMDTLSAKMAMTELSTEQKSMLAQSQTLSLDLVQKELLALDVVNCHVHRNTPASHVILLLAVHKCPRLFVTSRGKLLGHIQASDLLAKSRRFAL